LVFIKKDYSKVLEIRTLQKINAFRKGFETTIVSAFTNFYNMEPATYLPSYYDIGEKNVALLCVEIREFDQVAELLKRRSDFTSKESGLCLRSLVNNFAEVCAAAVESLGGRVDQYWGSGLLALFGEYMISGNKSGRIPCMEALSAANEIIENFRLMAQTWLNIEFRIEKFKELHCEHISLEASIGIDYGEVFFDYVGSAKNCVYMALGDHVDLVKKLANLSIRSEVEKCSDPAIRAKYSNQTYHSALDPAIKAGPILLSQTAYIRSKHIIKPHEKQSQNVHQPLVIMLPGKVSPYAIYSVAPENIDLISSQY
jgi:class 3 adenylate cyclase